MKEVFSQRLRALREAIGLSQVDFAKKINVSRASIGYYEAAQRVPDIDILDRICSTTGCSVNFLMGRSDNMKPGNEGAGALTGLSDRAIDVMIGNPDYSPIMSFIIEHKLFPKLMRLICGYPHEFNRGDESQFIELNFKGFTKFEIAETIGRIVDDYASAIKSGALAVPKFNLRFWDIDEARYMIERIKESLDNYEAISNEKSKEFRESFVKSMQEHKELLKTDLLYRFHHQMLSVLPPNDNPSSENQSKNVQSPKESPDFL